MRDVCMYMSYNKYIEQGHRLNTISTDCTGLLHDWYQNLIGRGYIILYSTELVLVQYYNFRLET